MSNRNELIIWDTGLYGIPKNFDEALEMADVLSEQSENNTSLMLKKFASKLTKFAKKAKEDDIWEDYHHIDEEVANNLYAAFVLEMPDRGWEDIVIKIAELASQFNLAIVYEEAITAFLPNNQVLPIENLVYWQALKESLKAKASSNFPKTLKQFKKWMEPQCEAMLAKHGFVERVFINDLSLYAYFRKLNDIYQYMIVGYHIDHYESEFTLSIMVVLSHDKINTIYNLFSFYPLDNSFNIPFNFAFYDEFNKVRIIKTHNSTNNLFKFLEDVLLFDLNKIQNITSLDNLVNGNNPYGNYLRTGCFIPMCIITARLANNPQYNELVKQFEQAKFWGANNSTRTTEWPKLLKYLQDEVQPLETTTNTAEVKDLPATIQKYLNQVVDEDMEQCGELDWDDEYTLKFWLIKDDDQLINFLRFGLTSAISKMLDDNEEAWQETNKNSENDDESMLRERQLFAKYPPIYAAVHDIFEFFAAFSFHGLSVIKSWSEEGMQNVLQAFQLLGLEKLATAYKAGRQNIRAFKTVMEFDISQQHLEVAEAVRKNYQLFLV